MSFYCRLTTIFHILCARILHNSVLEWYDFALFGYFSDVIGEAASR